MSKKSRARASAKAEASAPALTATGAKALAVTSARASAPPRPEATTFPVRRGTFLAGVLIVLAALAVYYNSFSTPFILDDQSAIADNPTIRQLGSALVPPPDATVGSRPMLNLTFALNYAWGGMNVWGYHAVNLFIHALAGLTLFGIVRWTLLRDGIAQSEFSECGRGALTPQSAQMRGEGTPPTVPAKASATVLALAVAVLWVVHPLQTEAVTYISQRAESLMGLFYLLTLYCFIRGVENRKLRTESQKSRAKASAFADATGDKTEDRESGGQRSERGSLPNSVFQLFSPSALWLAASVLACLLGVLSKEIIVTAPVIVLLYDRTFIAGSFREAWRLRWRYYLGLAGTWLLLARLMTGLHQRGVGFDQGVTWWNYALTSCRSVVLYLKLAIWPHPLVFDYGTGVVHRASEVAPYALILAGLLAGTAIALRRQPGLSFAAVWFFAILTPTSSFVPVAGQPMAEHRAYDLGNTLAQIPSRLPDAIVEYESALRINPDYAEAHYNLGRVLSQIPGRMPDAIAHFEAALQIRPDVKEVRQALDRLRAMQPKR